LSDYMRTKRSPLLLLLVLLLPLTALVASGAENKPNIVLVLMDNFGYGEIGVYGREGIKRSFGFTGPWRGTMFSPYEGSYQTKM